MTGDLTPMWWTPDIQPSRAGKKGNLPSCPGIPNSSNAMPWPSIRNNEDLSLNSALAELGINRASLHSWVKKYGTGKRARTKAMHDKAQAANDSERIRQLEKENAKLREERDILRKAAKYFAEETRW